MPKQPGGKSPKGKSRKPVKSKPSIRKGEMIMSEQPKSRQCGTMPVHERHLRTNPEYMRARAASETYARSFGLMRGMMARSGVTVIPVVVHVVHNTGSPEQNISDAQINSQILVLNRDFRKRNSDVSTTPSVFLPFTADARIEFELAKTDPQGNTTSGITRTQTTATSFTDDDGVKAGSSGGQDPWSVDKYLNIWVCNLQPWLGYAQFPGGPAATDGVVITHTAFGTTGSAAAPFNLGRTATHEIGHWLNLRHIWGDDGTGCNGSDFVDDTPNQGGPNYGTPTFPRITCENDPNGDMFMNYMDYVDDAAMVMFTEGQLERMQATLDSDRSTIGTVKPEPTLPTLKFNDDPGTLKFRDDPGTLKFRDDPTTLKFRDDPGTLKFRDDPTTLKFRDDIGTSPQIDPLKLPALDKPPVQDLQKAPGSDLGNIFGGLGNQPSGRTTPAAPFVLSTPHHSMAWRESYPSEAQSSAAAYEGQIQEYEEQLEACAQAEQAGTLSQEDRQEAEMLYQEYAALIEEYRHIIGG